MSGEAFLLYFFYVGFLSLSIIDILGQAIFCCRGYSMHWVFGSMAGLYLLRTSRTFSLQPSAPGCDNHKSLQTLPNALRGWEAAQITPQ